MKLTPIRVRGKKGKPKPEKKRKDNGLDNTDLEGPPSSKRARKHRGKDGEARMKNGLSRLSLLPQEVLERVFVYSQNLSLPLVSRDLHHRLSSDSIKYQMVGAAFGSAWDAYYGVDKFETSSYDGWQWDVKRIEGDSDFQSAILACSWAKIPVLLSSFDVWIRQHASGRAYFTIPRLRKERLEDTPRPGSLYDRAYITSDDDDDSASIMTMREKLGFDFDCFLRYILSPNPNFNAPHGRQPIRIQGDRLRALLGTHLEVHPGTKIPTALLSGPFESDGGAIDVGVEKMQRLFWLVRGGACLQEDQTWEATREGFQQILHLIANTSVQDPGDDHDEPPSGQGELTSSAPPPRAPPTPMERLKLAAGILALFDFLGVFDAQWPRYIVQTALLQVSRLIPGSAPRSPQEALLGALASKLRGVLGRHGGRIVDARHVGMAWAARLESPRAYVQREAGFADVCRQRAKMFLYPLEGAAEGDNLPSSPAVGAAVGGLGHEPWSDFGLD